MPGRGLLVIVSAPSGTGKTTLVERALAHDPALVRSRSYTSRAARPDERDGVDYNFIEESQFRQMVEAGAFLEWADVFGHLYGTAVADTDALRESGRDVVLVIDVQGAAQVRASGVDVVSVFVLPPSFEVLEARLRERSGGHVTEAELQRRLRTARVEVEARAEYDYVVVNDDLEDAVERLCTIVRAERSTAAAMREVGDRIAETFREAVEE